MNRKNLKRCSVFQRFLYHGGGGYSLVRPRVRLFNMFWYEYVFSEFPLKWAKTGNKNVQLVLQHYLKTNWKAMLAFYYLLIFTELHRVMLLWVAINICCIKYSQEQFCCSQQNLSLSHVYRPKTNLFCSRWRGSCVWPDSRVICPVRSQYSRNI